MAEYSITNYQVIVEELIPEWTRRSRTKMVSSKGPGCFIWDSRKDGIRGTGMFYMRDMVSNYFSGEMAQGLQQMIDEANHDSEGY